MVLLPSVFGLDWTRLPRPASRPTSLKPFTLLQTGAVDEGVTTGAGEEATGARGEGVEGEVGPGEGEGEGGLEEPPAKRSRRARKIRKKKQSSSPSDAPSPPSEDGAVKPASPAAAAVVEVPPAAAGTEETEKGKEGGDGDTTSAASQAPASPAAAPDEQPSTPSPKLAAPSQQREGSSGSPNEDDSDASTGVSAAERKRLSKRAKRQAKITARAAAKGTKGATKTTRGDGANGHTGHDCGGTAMVLAGEAGEGAGGELEASSGARKKENGLQVMMVVGDVPSEEVAKMANDRLSSWARKFTSPRCLGAFNRKRRVILRGDVLRGRANWGVTVVFCLRWEGVSDFLCFCSVIVVVGDSKTRARETAHAVGFHERVVRHGLLA